MQNHAKKHRACEKNAVRDTILNIQIKRWNPSKNSSIVKKYIRTTISTGGKKP